MQSDRPIGIDLFSGAGGMSLGFEQAGFDVVAAVEVDPIHAAVHERNFPETVTICRSVVGLSGEEIRRLAKIGRRRVDVVFGGAPCQGFSMIGQRALDDPRNSLVREFVRVVVELKASHFVFENVKGITLGKHAGFLDEIIEAFEEAGYSVRCPWQVLNAARYGVPQDRQRLFLIGARKGKRLPEYPEAVCRPAGSPGYRGELPAGPSCADALGDLPDAEAYPELLTSDAVRARWKRPSNYARILRGLADDAAGFGYRRRFDRELLTSSYRAEHTAESRTRFARTKGGKVEPISRFFRLPADGVSNTLRAGTDTARGAFTSPRPIHYQYARCVTVREMARLHGFPDWFRFHVTKWHGARQIGNAVPPPLARAVASSIVAAIGCKPCTPSRVLQPGSDLLLQLDMSEAARHFGIAIPIAQRRRKEAIGAVRPSILDVNGALAD